MKRSRLLRTLCALGFIGLVLLGLVLHSGTGTLSALGWRDVTAVCPLGALEAMLAERTLIPRALVGLGVLLVLGLLLGRVFCGWICPVPVVQRVKSAFTPTQSPEHDAQQLPGADSEHAPEGSTLERKVIPLVRAEAGAAKAHFGMDTPQDVAFDPAGKCSDSAHDVPNVSNVPKGPFVVLAGALASTAVFGFPVFCLVCPVGLTFALVIALWRVAEFNDLTWSIVFFAGFLFLELFVLRRWCRNFCPLGAVMTLFAWGNRLLRPKADPKRCLALARGLSCRSCRSACPEGLDPTALTQDLASARCTKCRACVEACPAGALSFTGRCKAGAPTTVVLQEPAAPQAPQASEASASLTPAAASIEAARCIECGACAAACPQGNPIPTGAALLRDGRPRAAALTLLGAGRLPEICGRVCPSTRLCESVCPIPADLGGPVRIAALERAAADHLLFGPWGGWEPWPEGAKRGHSVAVVGAGPFGLAFADVLARRGVAVTVFDRAAEVGGLLTFGIPAFKLDPAVTLNRRRMLERMGVNFRLGVEVGRDVAAEPLLDEFELLAVATGAEEAVVPNLADLELPGVAWARPWLARAAAAGLGLEGAAAPDLQGKRVFVLGSGDTAVDCLRVAVRLGAPSPAALCRRDAAHLRALPEEVAAAEREGARFLTETDLVELIGAAEGRLTGLRIRRRTGGAEEVLPADILLIACGFRTKRLDWLARAGVRFDDAGRIVLQDHQTSNPRILAGGDAVRGAALAAQAVQDGREAARKALELLGLSSRHPES